MIQNTGGQNSGNKPANTGTGKVGRRQFLSSVGVGGGALAAIAGFPQIVAPSVLGRTAAAAPNDRIHLGCIGSGGMGQSNLRDFVRVEDCRVMAMCDVKRDVREAAKAQVDEYYGNSDCLLYDDFRELLDNPDIDAVLIASPDHWHALHAIAAAVAGKDMYLEKPVGLTIEEAQLLRHVIHERERVFQFGVQQRSDNRFRQACELVRSGRIGKLKAVKTCTTSGADDDRSGLTRLEPEPAPDGLDYDMWLGPAPDRPYVPQRVVTPHWYHISDYSVGFIAGWGIHHIDICAWGMGVEDTGPVNVRGSARFPTPEEDILCDCPLHWEIEYEYADGVLVSFTGEGAGFEGHRRGVTFEGEDGWVWVNRHGIEAEPAKLLEIPREELEIQLYKSENHRKNFIDCVRSREETIAPIDSSVASEITCHLGWIAVQLGRELEWDPEKEWFPREDPPNRMMRREMKSPWCLPKMG